MVETIGSEVAHNVHGGVTREFFGRDAVVAKAKEERDVGVSQIQSSDGAPTNAGSKR
jgi:hypothetical protein